MLTTRANTLLQTKTEGTKEKIDTCTNVLNKAFTIKEKTLDAKRGYRPGERTFS